MPAPRRFLRQWDHQLQPLLASETCWKACDGAEAIVAFPRPKGGYPFFGYHIAIPAWEFSQISVKGD